MTDDQAERLIRATEQVANELHMQNCMKAGLPSPIDQQRTLNWCMGDGDQHMPFPCRASTPASASGGQ